MVKRLNLATYPFRNRTLPYVLSGLLVAFSVALGVYSLVQYNENQKQNTLLASSIKERISEIERLKGEGEKVQQLLTPDQRALLSAAHKLVANKSFGWSRLFSDLESVLPGGVSAARIAVQNVFQDGDRIKAELEFSVLSRDYASVITMIENMNRSGLFVAELRGQDLQKNERLTFTEFTLRLIYTPAYGYSASPPTDVAMNEQGVPQ